MLKSTKERADGERGAVWLVASAMLEIANIAFSWGLDPFVIPTILAIAAVVTYLLALVAGMGFTVGQMGEIEQIGREDGRRAVADAVEDPSA